ncbi:NADH-quinone oxidoreductase subunit NuoG [Aquicella lusitana]|uniref:NADH-quinone oxidoreductase n=1 Tax=Aquicella lusitana TaxID=254246 RepID=A0A370GYJ0_9COXI|nr:NADH-quinone oxidoreductase subunit NuoG [Aquicella lusitana]RDI46923.1 NADH dehydrogenase subunit G [Aquicella lusitana]VVC73814.1 NADH-quinone oxidoreductase chain 3 [Aquicella lusitana]
MADIEIEIDGRKLTAKPNQTVIQVADEAGIYIPRFCYHKHLSVAANCRMCLVEVEKSPKALPACATPVTPGMKVFTQSQKTIDAQRAVMEFLLINHPLDCPICDQGGECELQDLSMGYGSSQSCYTESKRAVANENLGPLIATEMTRCILCTRCVRFGAEVAGVRELGVTFRGEHEEISTFVEHAMTSEVSGNIIDLCPVGALTSKPYRFTARAWEMMQSPSISPHDCVGANLNIHTLYGKVMRVVSRENKAVNETWLADRDRFSYTGLYHADRLEEPLVRLDGKLQVVEWHKAFEMAATQLHEAIAEFGADKLGALASPNSTLEEFYLLQKIMRQLGSPHIDHRLREIDTTDQAAMPAFPGLQMSLTELEQSDAIILIGCNIQKEQPLVGLRVRKAALNGAAIVAVNPVDYEFNFKLRAKKTVSPDRIPQVLAALVNDFQAKFDNVSADDETKAITEVLRGKQKVSILLGAMALHHPRAATIRYLAEQLAEFTGARVGMLTDGANTAGGWLAGAVPHRHAAGEAINYCGLSAYAMLEKPRKAYLLLNVEPDLDCANAAHAIAALKQAKCVIALSMYRNPVLEAHADIILPIAPFTETAGTFINATGEWQSFNGVAQAYGLSRPAWKILRVLGNFLHLEGFGYESAEEVKHEIKALVEKNSMEKTKLTQPDHFSLTQETAGLTRIGEIPLYAVDSLVRRAKPLQDAQTLMEGDVAAIRMHPKTAAQFDLHEGSTVAVRQSSGEAQLSVMLDARIAEGAVWIAGGIAATSRLGDLIGKVEIEKL